METIRDVISSMGAPPVLRAARRYAGLSQGKLAELTGMSQRTVQYLEMIDRATVAQIVVLLLVCGALRPAAGRRVIPAELRLTSQFIAFLEGGTK